MNHKLLTFIGLIGVGVVIGATLDTLNKPEESGNNVPKADRKTETNSLSNPFSVTSNNTEDLSDLKQTLQLLQQQVQREIENRQQLEQKVALLEKELNLASDKNNTDTSQTLTSSTSSPHRPGTFSQNVNWFNEQALIDAGVDQTKVIRIKNVFEQAEMDKLYLRDQARREGWINSKRYSDATKEIADRTSALRSELSDEEYDAYLYAAGRSNRVIIESVLSNSPASNAGILPGDVILTYDNKRIYNWSDLTGATSEGTANSTVAVTIVRDNQQQQVYVPRGPLGVRLRTDSAAP
jgi:hypothetical protein